MSKLLSNIGKKKKNCWKEKQVEKSKIGSALKTTIIRSTQAHLTLNPIYSLYTYSCKTAQNMLMIPHMISGRYKYYKQVQINIELQDQNTGINYYTKLFGQFYWIMLSGDTLRGRIKAKQHTVNRALTVSHLLLNLTQCMSKL